MMSLLCMSVLLSGALHSYALTDLNSTEFKNKLEDLHASVPVYIIHTRRYKANIAYVRSTLRQVETSRQSEVYLYEVLGNSPPPSTRSTCQNRNRITATRKHTGPAVGKSYTESLEEMTNIMTSMTNKTPIFVVSIYSEFNEKKIRNVKCWIRDSMLRRNFIVCKVKFRNIPLTTRKYTPNSTVTTTASPVGGKEVTYRTFPTTETPENVETHTTDNKVQSSTAENQPETYSTERPSDLTDSGTESWASSSSFSSESKPNSGPASRRGKIQAKKIRTVRSIPDGEEYYDAGNFKSGHIYDEAAEETLQSYTSLTNEVENAKTNEKNAHDGFPSEDTKFDCEIGDVCAFSFSQSTTKVQSVNQITPSSSNLHGTEQKKFSSLQKNEGESSGSTQPTSFISTNSKLSTKDFLGKRPSHGYKHFEGRLESNAEPSRFYDGLRLKQDNTGDGRTSSSEEEGDRNGDSTERNTLPNFLSTQRPSQEPSTIPPKFEPSLEKVPEINYYDNIYDVNEIDDGSNKVWGSIHNGVEKAKNGIQNVMGKVKNTAEKAIETIKKGLTKVKEFGQNSLKKVLSFIS